MKGTILITGTSSGTGKATALYFAARGWKVAATMRSPEKAAELLKEENIRVFKLDLRESRTIDTAVKAALAAFGQIDVLFHNGGYGLVGPFESYTEEQIREYFDTHVFLGRQYSLIIPHTRCIRN